MEPLSSTNSKSSVDPTPAEVDAAACLPQEPEPLESRPAVAPLASEAAVATLVEKHPPPTPTPVASAPSTPSAPSAPATAKASAHPGIALSVGVSFVPAGKELGLEAAVGVVVDLGKPGLAVFASSGSGRSTAPCVSAGISAQASLLGNVTKFSGSGEDLGVNLRPGGLALNFSTPSPGGELELNGFTASFGPSIGVDAHDMQTTTDTWDLHDIKDALKRATGLPGLRRFGP